jgi:tRNA (guanine37-N1)-methyltransferase
MVMMAEPLEAAITHAKQLATKHGFSSVKTVLLSPQGLQWSHSAASAWQADGALEGLLLICGRYEGVDQRIINQYVDVEVSIGDFVLSGGELPAMVLMDSLVRLMDGALGDEQSAQMDSFSPLLHGLLDTSHYTKPVEFNGELVPKVLQSGNHARIAAWRFISSYNNTLHKRPDLLQGLVLNKQQIKWLQQVDEIQ